MYKMYKERVMHWFEAEIELAKANMQEEYNPVFNGVEVGHEKQIELNKAHIKFCEYAIMVLCKKGCMENFTVKCIKDCIYNGTLFFKEGKEYYFDRGMVISELHPMGNYQNFDDFIRRNIEWKNNFVRVKNKEYDESWDINDPLCDFECRHCNLRLPIVGCCRYF